MQSTQLSPQPQSTTECSVTISSTAFSRFTYGGIIKVHSLLCLPSFPQQIYFEIHRYSVPEYFIPFFCWVVVFPWIYPKYLPSDLLLNIWVVSRFLATVNKSVTIFVYKSLHRYTSIPLGQILRSEIAGIYVTYIFNLTE